MFKTNTKMRYDESKLSTFGEYVEDFIASYNCEVTVVTSHNIEVENEKWQNKLVNELSFTGNFLTEDENIISVGTLSMSVEGDAKKLAISLNQVLRTCGEEILDTETLTNDFIDLIRSEEDRMI